MILKVHEAETHGSLKLFKCNNCDASFNEMRLLKFHVARLHKKSNSLLKSTHSSLILNKSQKKKTNVRKIIEMTENFKCKYCNTSFDKTEHLKAHFLSKA